MKRPMGNFFLEIYFCDLIHFSIVLFMFFFVKVMLIRHNTTECIMRWQKFERVYLKARTQQLLAHVIEHVITLA